MAPQWELQLFVTADGGPDVTAPFNPTSNPSEIRLIKDGPSSYLFSFGKEPSLDTRTALATFYVGDGAVRFQPLIRGFAVAPTSAYSNSNENGTTSLYRFQVDPSSSQPEASASSTSTWIRPGDSVIACAGDFSIEIVAIPESSTPLAPTLSLANVEVKSSAANGEIDDESNDEQVDESETDDEEDDLDAPVIRETTATPGQPPFSTAKTHMSALVEETPTANRTRSLPGPPNEKPATSAAPSDGEDEDADEDADEDEDTRDPDESIENDPSTPTPKVQPVQTHSGTATLDDSAVLSPKTSLKRQLTYKKRSIKEVDASEVITNSGPKAKRTKSQPKSSRMVQDDDDDDDDDNNIKSIVLAVNVPKVISTPSVVIKTAKQSSQTATEQSTAAPPRIIFSSSQVDSQAGMLEFLRAKGATVARDIAVKQRTPGTQTICCVGSVKTTAKVLMALVKGYEIVKDDWAKGCKKAGKLIPIDDFRAENLNSGIDRGALFEGKTVAFTKAAKKDYGDGFARIEDILQAAGADDVVVKSARDLDGDQNMIVIGLESKDADANTAMANGVTCYKKDMISQSILKARLMTTDELQIGGSSQEAKEAPKSKKSKAGKA